MAVFFDAVWEGLALYQNWAMNLNPNQTHLFEFLQDLGGDLLS